MGLHEFFGQLPTALSGVVDVKVMGAKGDGVVDDTAAIQTAIDTSPVGACIYFPPGTYLISATIRQASRRAYLGMGGRAGLSTLKAKTGFTGPAMMAPVAWWNSSQYCDNPVRVEGLQFDLSSISNLIGLVQMNFWSTYYDLQFLNGSGTGCRGFLGTDRGRDGTTIIQNSTSENRYLGLRFDAFASGAFGFVTETNNGQSNQDGHLLDCYFSTINGDAVSIGRAAGWSVENNHLYGIGGNGIMLYNAYATKALRNYIEGFGEANVSGQYYNGIAMPNILDSRASIMADNTVSTTQPATPTAARWTCYYARAGSGQLRAHLVRDGNTAVWAAAVPNTNRAYGYHLGESSDADRVLYVENSGNQLESARSWQVGQFVATGSSVVVSQPSMVGHSHPELAIGYASGVVPSGSALPVISHGLGTLDVNVTVRDVSSGLIIPVAAEAISTTQVRLTFRTAPTSGQYRYLIQAGGPTVTSNVPKMMGPYVPGSAIAASALSAGPKILASVTVPDLGFDWEPLCYAEIEMRTDISGSRPALQVREGSATGIAYANGTMSTETTTYTMVQAIPIAGATPSLAAGQSRTLHLVAVNAYGGGWIQTTTLSAQFAVWAIPA